MQSAAGRLEGEHAAHAQPDDSMAVELMHLIPCLWEERREKIGREACQVALREGNEVPDEEFEAAMDELCVAEAQGELVDHRAGRGRRRGSAEELPDEVMIREYEPEDLDESTWSATDDVHHGRPLDLQRLREARREEMEFVKKLAVYRYAKRTTMIAEGHKAVRVRWVDQDKGARYRARLCAMEFRRKSEAPCRHPTTGKPPSLGCIVGDQEAAPWETDVPDDA